MKFKPYRLFSGGLPSTLSLVLSDTQHASKVFRKKDPFDPRGTLRNEGRYMLDVERIKLHKCGIFRGIIFGSGLFTDLKRTHSHNIVFKGGTQSFFFVHIHSYKVSPHHRKVKTGLIVECV